MIWVQTSLGGRGASRKRIKVTGVNVDYVNFYTAEGSRDGYHLREEFIPVRNVTRLPSMKTGPTSLSRVVNDLVSVSMHRSVHAEPRPLITL